MSNKPVRPQELSKLVRKRRWSKSDAANVVQAWRDSGTSRRAFCERHDLDEQRLARWAKKFPAPPRLAELVVVGELPSTTKPSLVIEFGEARVHVERDVDDELLARVLRIVGSLC